jgi:hypothetical protein
MASGILLTIVVTVTSAINAGQQHSYEAQTRIVGTLAADELLGRITSEDYYHIVEWNGHKEEVGAMTDMAANDLPESFSMVGRKAEVASSLLTLADLDVRVRGYTVTVRSFDGHGRILAEVTRFVPEPQS